MNRNVDDWRWYRHIKAQERSIESAQRLKRLHYQTYRAYHSRQEHKHEHEHEQAHEDCHEEVVEEEEENAMPSHIKFAFGLGNYFKFSFSFGRLRDIPPAKDESKKALADFDKAMAKVRAS